MMRNSLSMLLRLAASLSLVFPTLGCTPARLLNAAAPKEGYRVESGIAYGEAARHKLDIYVPDGPLQSAKVIVFFYGGRWEFGAKADYLFVGQALANEGFITILADYRLYPEVTYPAFIEDGAKAVRWTKDHVTDYGGDPDQIFLMGHSAGAYIATMLALDPKYLETEGLTSSELAGVIGLAGPYDFLPIKDPVISEVFASGDIEETQPINRVTGRNPPMLLLTGKDDVTVLPRNSQALADSINRKGGYARIKTYDGLAHIGVVLSLTFPFRWLAPVLQDVKTFLDEPGTSKKHAA